MQTIRKKVHIGNDGKLSVDTELKNCDVDVTIRLELETTNVLVFKDVSIQKGRRKYDFSDLQGQLKWKGSFLDAQNNMRNEWE
jgi:hypothetical protein